MSTGALFVVVGLSFLAGAVTAGLLFGLVIFGRNAEMRQALADSPRELNNPCLSRQNRSTRVILGPWHRTTTAEVATPHVVTHVA